MDDAIREVVTRWLMKADNDLQTAIRAVEGDPPITDTACFYTQQCVEKSFKAQLAYFGEHIEKTHSLVRLLELCSENDLEYLVLHDTALSLNDYAIVTRYPDDWREIPLDEAKDAIRQAVYVLKFVKQKLEAKP